MTHRILRTSTSLALIMSLSVPFPVRAQEALPDCGADAEAPCVMEDGTVFLTPEDAEKALQDSDLGTQEPEAEEPAAEPEPQAEEAAPEAAEEPAAEAEEPAAEEQPAEVEAEQEQPAADAEQPAPEAEEPAAEAEQPAAEAEQPAAEAEQSAPEAEQPAAEPEQPAAEEEQPAADTAEPPEAEEPAAEAEAPAEAEQSTEEEPAEEAAQEILPIEEPETVISEDTGLTEEAAAAEAETAAETQGAEPAAAAAAATGAEASATAEEPEVTTQTVTKQDVRSSDQDFKKKKKKNNNAKKSDDDDGGLSDLEKILLAGAGAAVVGAILKNGSTVVENTGDRVVAQRDDGSIYVLRDDDALVRRPGDNVETQTYNDGSTITTVTKANGEVVRTIRDAQGRVLRRARVFPDGTEYLLFDDTVAVENVDVSTLPRQRADRLDYSNQDAELEAALNRELGYDVGRRFSLSQIRNIRAVRELVPQIDLESVTFDTGSAAIRATEAQKLARLGDAMRKVIEDRPGEVFLIEGHTDAVGSAVSNLTLSDRRAESLALALTEYFDIPPENMVVQGYGEGYLKVASDGDIRANRRVAVRRITPLLGMQTASR